MSQFLKRNTTIPTKRSEVFSTTEDNQVEVTIRIFQGEKKMVAENAHVGNITLTGLAPAPRGLAMIEVTLDIDANGILHVQAKDLQTMTQVKATLDRPDCCLNTAQMKVLSRKVAAETQRIQTRITAEHN